MVRLRVWVWLGLTPPDFTFVLVFMIDFPFSEARHCFAAHLYKRQVLQKTVMK